MFGQVVFRSFLWFVFCAALTIGITGCDDDDDRIDILEDNDDWIGTWEVESIDGEILEQSLAELEQSIREEVEDLEIDFFITANDWIFDDDGTMDWELGMKFEAKEEGFGLLWEGSLKIIGIYTVVGFVYILEPILVAGTGIFEEFVEQEGPIGPTDRETGTWSRKGNTLTLNSDDGSTIVLKKK